MKYLLAKIRHSIGSKLILTVGLVLLVSISTWAYYNIDDQKKRLMEEIINNTDRLTTTIRLGAHYAMMLNSRDDINQIINNISKLSEIVNIRIYNKQGRIQYTNIPGEVNHTTNIKAEACYICHRTEPPMAKVPLSERTRIFTSPDGQRLLGIISPISNEPGCASECHFHPKDKQVLGALDVVVSLSRTDAEISRAEKGIIALAAFVFLLPSAIIFLLVMRFVNQPIRRLIDGTRLIGAGDYATPVGVERADEMGQLSMAINQMQKAIGQKQAEINHQRDEYQNLFERVPCLITVQNREYRLINYNHMFADMFDPDPGDYCYHAYKGRDTRCPVCPVEKTFRDGDSHYSEESGVNKDGTVKHWIVRSSPIRDEYGNIVAAMEINLDITERKQLEVELEKSEKKYHAIFNNIPNPVFVLDPETFEILDTNMSVTVVYGHEQRQITGSSFLDLFVAEERDTYAEKLQYETVLNQVRHIHCKGRTLFVNIRISPSAEYSGRKVLLVTTSDITKRLEAEQQLIQASKMATLGEMATGVAHELNQPLSVIKTVSSFFIKKINRKEVIEEKVLNQMLAKVDKNVDRAAKIINHMRQFARKSDMRLERLSLNEVLANAFEIFSQQLKVRGIEVIWHLDDQIPKISGDASRLEQVFINLLVNARDAIEERWARLGGPQEDDRIILATRCEGTKVVCTICDTGIGISQALADKIFEPFFTTKEVGKGTGLGLSISYGIIQECGGTIRVAGHHPQGTCFVLTFPVQKERHGIGRKG